VAAFAAVKWLASEQVGLGLLRPFGPATSVVTTTPDAGSIRVVSFRTYAQGRAASFAEHLDADGDGVACDPLPAAGRDLRPRP
jgi:hypothetical protein